MSKALTGKWQWNGMIEPMYDAAYDLQHYVWFKSGFISNGQRFEGIRFRFDDIWRLEYTAESGYVEAGAGYYGDDYATPFEQYRVIDFGTGSEANDDSDGTFVAWFLDNVTRYGTVAENIVQIAENEKAVYQSGYNKALEKGGYNAGFEAGKTVGKQEEYDAFWNVYQENGTRTNYQYGAFGGDGWTDKIFKPKYPIKVIFGYGMFTGCQLTKIKDIDFSLAGDLIQVMYICQRLEEVGVVNAPLSTNASMSFSGDYKLHTIEKLVIGEQCAFDRTFVNCSALENITFEGVIGNDINFQWSTKLTRASIESIINHLSDTASRKTLTLSKEAADNAFPCPIEDGNGGWINVGCGGNGEWLELIAPKVENGKWIIDLV